MLFSSQKVRLPNIFVSTAFKKHKDFLKSDNKGESSTLFFYLPSTMDRKESINQFKSNVQLHLIDCSYEKFSEFSSKQSEIAREIVINYMKHIANVSNSNLKRNASVLLINGNVSDEAKIQGMEVECKKCKLSY